MVTKFASSIQINIKYLSFENFFEVRIHEIIVTFCEIYCQQHFEIITIRWDMGQFIREEVFGEPVLEVGSVVWKQVVVVSEVLSGTLDNFVEFEHLRKTLFKKLLKFCNTFIIHITLFANIQGHTTGQTGLILNKNQHSKILDTQLSKIFDSTTFPFSIVSILIQLIPGQGECCL